jgi:CheY-like chemotaxis protein
MRNGKSILIIESDIQLRDTLCEAFEFEGYSARCASDWNSLLKDNEENVRPDLIFWDTKMPLVEAKLFVGRLRNDPFYSEVPVVIISNDIYQAKLGSDLSIIPKSFDLELILSIASELSMIPTF